MNDISPSSSANKLKALEQYGQSPWLDFIQRSFLTDGSLKILIERDGLKGMTSNPSIFEKAMGHGTDYDPGFKRLAEQGDLDAQTIYETLAIEDIQHAADLLRPVYDATRRIDGYVSLEVSPYLALHTDATIAEAHRLWKAVARDNLMIKVPGTPQGVPAIRSLISEGMNINVTLLFSLDAYKAVAEAFIAGLEAFRAKGGDVSRVASVASFFVSRIDTVIDKKIDERIKGGDAEAEALHRVRGKTAIANAKMAYEHYLSLVGGERWKTLEAAGAMPQRLLWASTGTKDKAYSDVLYVEELIGNATVNTMPPATMDAFRDHGHLRNALVEDVDGAREIMQTVERLGLDLGSVTTALVKDGVKSFAKAADDLLSAVAAKRTAMLGDKLAKVSSELPEALGKAVEASLEDWREHGKVRQLWAHDSSLWTGGPESKWLAWLDIVADRIADLPKLQAFQDEVRAAGYSHVLLLGMGGSSLGPEVLAETFGHRGGFPELVVLDSTDPQQIASFEKKVNLATTLVIVSSKSGGTLEPNILKAYFFDRMQKAVGKDKAGSHFVAVTDPGSHMQKVAEGDHFAHVFYGNPAIGGRYSVLSNFGMVPAAAMGLDLAQFLSSAARMVRACAAGTPPLQNPGVQLGTVLGVAAKGGRDKVTITASPGIYDVGAWLEQLLAESTGKQGHGIVQVDAEPLAGPSQYGNDRLFAYLRLTDAPDPAQDAAIAALAKAGQPVVRVEFANTLQLGQAFFLWEFATAVAGSIIGIDAFDQPDVEASKIETKKLTEAYSTSGTLPAETPFLTDGPIKLYSDAKNAAELSGVGNTLDAVIKAHLGRLGAGDYAALLAYIERTPEHIALLQTLRTKIRDVKHVATVAEFGPRFLHSTGQAYKGGPNSGVFLQITADDTADLQVPGEKYSFSVVKAAQARGDFDVLAERGRRALRVHITGDLQAGLGRLAKAITAAVG
jgi:transaldolase / glucose-6-phosphate isomerase